MKTDKKNELLRVLSKSEKGFRAAMLKSEAKRS